MTVITPQPRILGKGIVLKIGADDYSADMIEVELEPKKASRDVVTFGDASQPGGATDWTLKIKAITSVAAKSLWSWFWDHAGEDSAFTFAPHANAVATTDQPHFTGTITPELRPGIKAKANDTSQFDIEIPLKEGTSPALVRA